MQLSWADVVENTRTYHDSLRVPDKADSRLRDGILFPAIYPRFCRRAQRLQKRLSLLVGRSWWRRHTKPTTFTSAGAGTKRSRPLSPRSSNNSSDPEPPAASRPLELHNVFNVWRLS